MDNKKYILLVIFGLIFLGGLIFTFSRRDNNRSSLSFIGTVEELDTSCSFDGVCKVKVGNYWIITDLGGDPSPKMSKERGPRGMIYKVDGSTTGNLMDEKLIGQKVEVKAKQIGDYQLTLYGDQDYYIKLLVD